jgi:hypothetical protein
LGAGNLGVATGEEPLNDAVADYLDTEAPASARPPLKRAMLEQAQEIALIVVLLIGHQLAPPGAGEQDRDLALAISQPVTDEICGSGRQDDL